MSKFTEETQPSNPKFNQSVKSVYGISIYGSAPYSSAPETDLPIFAQES